MARGISRALAKATRMGINPIAGYGDKARQASSQYKASPRSVNGNLQPAQFGWFQKTAKTMMDTYPWSGGKHRAATQAQSARKNAFGTDYIGRHRGEAKEPDLVGKI